MGLDQIVEKWIRPYFLHPGDNALNSDPEEKTSAKKETSGTGAGIAIGLCIGVALGVALDNIGVGIAMGIAIGAGSGAAIEQKRKKEK